MIKECTNCKYSKWVKKPSGKRDLWKGECTFEVIIPASYIDYLGRMPIKNVVHKKYLANFSKGQCSCWERIKKNINLQSKEEVKE